MPPALGILVLSGLVLLPVLLPVARTDNNLALSTNITYNDLDKLSMGNIKVGIGLFINFPGWRDII